MIRGNRKRTSHKTCVINEHGVRDIGYPLLTMISHKTCVINEHGVRDIGYPLLTMINYIRVEFRISIANFTEAFVIHRFMQHCSHYVMEVKDLPGEAMLLRVYVFYGNLESMFVSYHDKPGICTQQSGDLYSVISHTFLNISTWYACYSRDWSSQS